MWLFSNEAKQGENEPSKVFLVAKARLSYEFRPPAVRGLYTHQLPLCCPLHEASWCGRAQSALKTGASSSPEKWLFILGSEAISGCEVTSEIYKLLLTSRNTAFVILLSVSCGHIGTHYVLPKNIIWQTFMFGSYRLAYIMERIILEGRYENGSTYIHGVRLFHLN